MKTKSNMLISWYCVAVISLTACTLGLDHSEFINVGLDAQITAMYSCGAFGEEVSENMIIYF